MFKSVLGIFLVLPVALLAGCAEGPYVYRPAQSTASVSGMPASRQPVPKDKPSGDIVVASSGVIDVKGTNPPMRAVFARVVVTNQSDDVPWTFDTRKQQAILNGQPTTAAFVNAYDGYDGSTSDVRVSKGQSRTVDFYFPLAAGTDELPPFELAWTIQTGRAVVADRSVFERVPVEPVYTPSPYYPSYYGYYGGYYGPYGYYDPFWPRTSVGIGLHFGNPYGFYGYPHHYHGYPGIYRGGGLHFRGRLR